MSQQIRKRSLKQFAVDGDKLRLEKDQQVRALNSSNVEVSLIKLDSQDKVVVFNPAINGTDEVAFKAESHAYTDQKISDLVNGAPALLDTLQELAAALGSDENFSTTILNRFAAVEGDLADEISRAQIAEQSLASSISSEAQSRIDGDASEQSRAQMAEQSLASSISSEAQSRIDGDASEQSRAQMAEASLATSISNEAFDRIASVNAEQSRAEGVESSLQSQIDSLSSQTGSGLANEISRAQASEQSLAQAIAAESSRADAAEQLLNSALTGEINGRQAGDAAEMSRAMAAESSLAGSIVTEKNRAQASEQSLASALSQEIIDREADVTAEENRAQLAESSLAQSVLTEKNRAEAAEASLASSLANTQNAVEFIQSNIDPAALDSLTEIVQAYQTMDGSIQSALESLSSTASSNLGQEISRAQAAEQSLASSISQEVIDRQADVDEEMSRAMVVEQGLEDSKVSRTGDSGMSGDFVISGDPTSMSLSAVGVTVSVNADDQRSDLNATGLTFTDEVTKTAVYSRDIMSISSLQYDKYVEINTDYSEFFYATGSGQGCTLAVDETRISLQTMTANGITRQLYLDPTSMKYSKVTGDYGSTIENKILFNDAGVFVQTITQNGFDVDGNPIEVMVPSPVSYESQLTTKKYVDDKVSVESSRAMGVEATLLDYYHVERSRAMSIEGALQGYINNEVSRATAVESSLQNQINSNNSTSFNNLQDEISRATGVEASLQSQIDSLSGSATSSLGAEISRAQAAEASLASSISSEVSRAQGVESDFESRISVLEAQTDGPYFFKQKETISNASTFTSVTLSNAPVANSVCVQLGRLMLIEGEDYSVSGSVVTLMGDVVFGGVEGIENGDVIIVSYAKDV